MTVDSIRKHSLSIVTASVFLVMLAGTVVMGPREYMREQGLTRIADWSEFAHWWAFRTTMSLEADVFGFLIIVMFTKWFIEIKSAESKDPGE